MVELSMFLLTTLAVIVIQGESRKEEREEIARIREAQRNAPRRQRAKRREAVSREF